MVHYLIPKSISYDDEDLNYTYSPLTMESKVDPYSKTIYLKKIVFPIENETIKGKKCFLSWTKEQLEDFLKTNYKENYELIEKDEEWFVKKDNNEIILLKNLFSSWRLIEGNFSFNSYYSNFQETSLKPITYVSIPQNDIVFKHVRQDGNHSYAYLTKPQSTI